jgi:MinD superfamily P-loop ATPase
MREIVVLSGKGGTGKTCITAALGDLAARNATAVLVDADVDAANLGLICDPTRVREHQFFGGRLATIDPSRCTGCGICGDVCRFDAIERKDEHYAVISQNCEGCDACVHQCPEAAITSDEQQAGMWFESTTRYGPLVHAHLFAGAENSGKLVATVKRHGRALASAHRYPLMLVDGPPGTGCPVIAAVSGVDGALLVTEPSVAALHDLTRVHEILRHFNVPAAVILNKADIFADGAEQVRRYCTKHGLELISEVPFDPAVPAAMASGLPITRFAADSATAVAVEQAWQALDRLK